MKLPTIVIAAICVVGTTLGVPLSNWNTEDVQNVLATVPLTARRTFITAKIDLGYRIKYLDESWKDQGEANIAVKMFDYFLENQDTIRKSKNTESYVHLMDDICYPEPIGCLDPNDPSIRPI